MFVLVVLGKVLLSAPAPDNNANKTEGYDCSSFSFFPDCRKHNQRRFCRRYFLSAGVLIGRIQRQAKKKSPLTSNMRKQQRRLPVTP